MVSQYFLGIVWGCKCVVYKKNRGLWQNDVEVCGRMMMKLEVIFMCESISFISLIDRFRSLGNFFLWIYFVFCVQKYIWYFGVYKKYILIRIIVMINILIKIVIIIMFLL